MFDIYYKIIKDDTANKGMSVVCLQEFDEKDYIQDLFIRDDNDEILIFKTEEAAQQYIDEYEYVLQVGDYLIKDNKIYTVVVNGNKYFDYYSIKDINSYSEVNLTSTTLKELTYLANVYGYEIYSKDKYDLILQKK